MLDGERGMEADPTKNATKRGLTAEALHGSGAETDGSAERLVWSRARDS